MAPGVTDLPHPTNGEMDQLEAEAVREMKTFAENVAAKRRAQWRRDILLLILVGLALAVFLVVLYFGGVIC